MKIAVAVRLECFRFVSSYQNNRNKFSTLPHKKFLSVDFAIAACYVLFLFTYSFFIRVSNLFGLHFFYFKYFHLHWYKVLLLLLLSSVIY